MNILKIVLRIPFGLAGCLFMLCFIPFAAIIFLPAGLLWIINTISLLSPLVTWFIKIDDFTGMEYKERIEFFLLPLLFPFLFGYEIIRSGNVSPDFVLKRFSI